MRGYIGYVSYSGALVEDGVMDARKAAQALVGLDEAVRFFVGQQNHALKDVPFELPVRVRKGSWEMLIPFTVEQAVMYALTVAGTGIGVYTVTALKKLAENDVKDKTTRDVFRKALEALQWTIRIGRHVGGTTVRTFHKLKFRKANQEVGIPNAAGEYLYVPKGFLEMYASARPGLLEKLAGLVEEDRKLVVVVYRGQRVERETLERRDRACFVDDPTDDDDVLFPELKHDDEIVLEGALTRANRETNSVGFKYRDHILHCVPAEGSVVRFKKFIFGGVRIHGRVSRLDEFGRVGAARPKIEIRRIEAVQSGDANLDLFEAHEAQTEGDE
jgi:hypothetical protein